MRAIDLYSGVGGWTLGLRMAGIKVIRSYEWWSEANRTHNANFGTSHSEHDVRQLDKTDLPRPGTVDIVVGSPPCTQFSFSNRGGAGDIQDGLKDIRKFLEVVQYLQPTYWAMENVPRVAGILKEALAPKGPLARFRKLVKVIEVVDSADFGVPQNRRRMIAGDFPVELFNGYKAWAERRTLGDVVRALAQDDPVDPVYGFKLAPSKLTDHVQEPPLDGEERRLNEESKRYHPVYNLMQFPDSLVRPSRTITATCTRVSRESIVIQDPRTKVFRRLTVRERASVQSFPITYQFHGSSYSSRQKMVGNAVPPLLTYHVALSMRRVPVAKASLPKGVDRIHPLPGTLAGPVKVDVAGQNYPEDRRFRAAVPRLRFGSGVRFDLANSSTKDGTRWAVEFYFGPSKDIKTFPLDRRLSDAVLAQLKSKAALEATLARVEDLVTDGSEAALQSAWTRRAGGMTPHQLIDRLGVFAGQLERSLRPEADVCRRIVAERVRAAGLRADEKGGKFAINAVQIVAGMLLGSRLNGSLAARRAGRPRLDGSPSLIPA